MHTDTLFHDYFERWVQVYKEKAVSQATLNKYHSAHDNLHRLAHAVPLSELTKRSYQELLNAYADTHAKQTTRDFHTKLKACLQDAVDEGLLSQNPAHKAIIKGTDTREVKQKYLNAGELTRLLRSLQLYDEPSPDWLVLILARTGLRFSEALALTPEDIRLASRHICIARAWDYKSTRQGFTGLKTTASTRRVYIDKALCIQLKQLTQELDKTLPMFAMGRVHNSGFNQYLARLCRKADVPVISAHGLRHTYASLLISQGVSLATVSKQLGHANVGITQQVYVHLIRELEMVDRRKIEKCMAGL